MKLALRIAIGLLTAGSLAIALLPLLVLLDLGDGGTGWGLCDDGVSVCRNSYFAGFELIALLSVALFGALALIAILVRVLRSVERREKQRDDPSLLIG